MIQNVDIILASGSPRRKELLEQAGLKFQIIKSEKEERITKTDPVEVVQELAHQKAEDVSSNIHVQEFSQNVVKDTSQNVVKNSSQDDQRPSMIIGSDTVVVNQGKILGKPKDEEDALRILMSLSGRAHSVYTGVSVIIKDEKGETVSTFSEKTDVYMYPFTKEDALKYIATKEPMDKAGAYGIQGLGGIFVEKIEGDYNNVVGFPLSRFVRFAMANGYIEM